MNGLIPVLGLSILLRAISQPKSAKANAEPIDGEQDEFREKLRENVADKMAEVFVTVMLAAATRVGIR